MFLGLCRPRAPLRAQWLCSGAHAIRRPVPENAACCRHRNAHGGAVTTAEQLQAELWVFFDQENWVWPGVAIQAIVFSRPSCQPSSLPQSRTHINRHTRLSNEWRTSAQCDRSQPRNTEPQAARHSVPFRLWGFACAMLRSASSALPFVAFAKHFSVCALIAFGERQCRWAVLHDQDSVCRPEDTVLPAAQPQKRAHGPLSPAE